MGGKYSKQSIEIHLLCKELRILFDDLSSYINNQSDTKNCCMTIMNEIEKIRLKLRALLQEEKICDFTETQINIMLAALKHHKLMKFMIQDNSSTLKENVDTAIHIMNQINSAAIYLKNNNKYCAFLKIFFKITATLRLTSDVGGLVHIEFTTSYLGQQEKPPEPILFSSLTKQIK